MKYEDHEFQGLFLDPIMGQKKISRHSFANFHKISIFKCHDTIVRFIVTYLSRYLTQMLNGN